MSNKHKSSKTIPVVTQCHPMPPSTKYFQYLLFDWIVGLYSFVLAVSNISIICVFVIVGLGSMLSTSKRAFVLLWLEWTLEFQFRVNPSLSEECTAPIRSLETSMWREKAPCHSSPRCNHSQRPFSSLITFLPLALLLYTDQLSTCLLLSPGAINPTVHYLLTYI